MNRCNNALDASPRSENGAQSMPRRTDLCVSAVVSCWHLSDECSAIRNLHCDRLMKPRPPGILDLEFIYFELVICRFFSCKHKPNLHRGSYLFNAGRGSCSACEQTLNIGYLSRFARRSWPLAFVLSAGVVPEAKLYWDCKYFYCKMNHECLILIY